MEKQSGLEKGEQFLLPSYRIRRSHQTLQGPRFLFDPGSVITRKKPSLDPAGMISAACIYSIFTPWDTTQKYKDGNSYMPQTGDKKKAEKWWYHKAGTRSECINVNDRKAISRHKHMSCWEIQCVVLQSSNIQKIWWICWYISEDTFKGKYSNYVLYVVCSFKKQRNDNVSGVKQVCVLLIFLFLTPILWQLEWKTWWFIHYSMIVCLRKK